MDYLKKTFLPIFIAGIWLNISATVKWIFLIESYWIEKYNNIGLVFPSESINNIVWMIWGFLFAAMIFEFHKNLI